MPCAIVHLAAEHHGADVSPSRCFLQVVIALFNAGEYIVGLTFLANKHAHQLNPFCLAQRIEFLVSQMGHQCDTRFLDGLIAASFERRDKNNVRAGSQHHLRIEIALRTNLHDASILHALEYVFVEEVLCPR